MIMHYCATCMVNMHVTIPAAWRRWTVYDMSRTLSLHAEPSTWPPK